MSNVSQTLTTGALLVANTSSQAPLPSQTHAISSTKIVTSVTQSMYKVVHYLLPVLFHNQYPPAQSNPNVSVAQSKADTGHTVIPRFPGYEHHILQSIQFQKLSVKVGILCKLGCLCVTPQIFVSTQSTLHISLSGERKSQFKILLPHRVRVISGRVNLHWETLGRVQINSPLQYGQQRRSYAGHQTYNYGTG